MCIASTVVIKLEHSATQLDLHVVVFMLKPAISMFCKQLTSIVGVS